VVPEAFPKSARLAVAALFGALLNGCAPELPGIDTPGARVYLEACGSCHVAIPPSALKYASWEFQVDRMDEFRRARGWGPLPAEQRTIVLNYLKQHAG
jgi:hypothetical protein